MKYGDRHSDGQKIFSEIYKFEWKRMDRVSQDKNRGTASKTESESRK